jgi:hypothetical protein
MNRKPRLPPNLSKLQTMTFVRTPAPTSADHERTDVIYDVRSASTLVNEYEKRKARRSAVSK